MASEDYFKKLQDPRWQKRRLEIFERDGFECQNCGRNDLTLVVHHRKYKSGYEPWDYENHLLLTLCQECHEAEKDIGKECKKLIDTLKEKFLTDDIRRIHAGFFYLPIIKNSAVTAAIIEVALQNPVTLEFIEEKYFEFIESKNRKKMKDYNAQDKKHKT